MYNKFTESNRSLAENSGMEADEINKREQEGMVTIQFLISEVYEVLVANDLLK